MKACFKGVISGHLFFKTSMVCAMALWFQTTCSQKESIAKVSDSIVMVQLEEVILISATNELEYLKQSKPLTFIDQFLEEDHAVSMVKRGAYAWEPMVNCMPSERLAITIDGMRIFSGCTDKMDPITSYVDVSNLCHATVDSGQEGAKHGTTVGGAVDLQLEKSGFTNKGLRIGLDSGLETNNMQRIVGAEGKYATDKLYVDGDLIYRKAENYTAGGGEEVAFSQFEKYNLSVNAGFKINDDNELATTLIYDEARDVGYPALPMDVSLARGIISSLEWKSKDFWVFNSMKSKVYFNTITHIMDDSKRPDVPIRMDMPGWSDTYGFLNEGRLGQKNHYLTVKWDGYYNRSLAEMTMYPNNPNEPAMFMLTWPDVKTLYSGIYMADKWQLKNSNITLATRLSIQNNTIADDFGLNSLRIFYPGLEASQNRFLKSFSVSYNKPLGKFDLTTGISYGDRAPSVSEGFGFYLFNSFDNHDYIGDPNLENEQSFEANTTINYKTNDVSFELAGNYFYLPNYIIGEVDPTLDTMTIGADGVKIYTNLEHATQYNISLKSTWTMDSNFSCTGNISYHRGYDDTQRNLPFISPLAYGASVTYTNESFSGSLQMTGAGDQTNFNPEFGEDRTDAFTVFAADFGKTFSFGKNNLIYIKAGVQNIFDTYYSTYSDWANIPRMGRNFFTSITYNIN